MGNSAAYLSYDEFDRVHIRIGRIVDVQDFTDARQAAYRILIDFGPDIGIRKSSAQATKHYAKTDLLNRLVVAVVNLRPDVLSLDSYASGMWGRSHQTHGREHGEADREHDEERRDVLDEIRLEPRQNLPAISRGERRLDAEPEQTAERERGEEHRCFYFERPGGDHERGERKRRRNQIEDGERDRAAVADAGTDSVEPFLRHVPIQTFFADLHSGPERERCASDGSERRQQRHDPPRPPHLRRQNHDSRVDAKREVEEHRGVERRQSDHAGGTDEERDNPL